MSFGPTVKSRSIGLDILLTIITFGLWNFYVQIRQIWDLNDLEPSRELPPFYLVVIFSLLTFGLYFCYHEYKMTQEIHLLIYGQENKVVELLFAVMTFMGLWVIVDVYQQSLMNNYIEKVTSIGANK